MAGKVQKTANLTVLAIVFVPMLVLSICGTRDKARHTLVTDQMARAREVQNAVENYLYINHGRLPRAVYQKGLDRRTIGNFLPGQRKFLNLATGQESEPRDYAELVLNKGPDRYGIYYRYFPKERKYAIYCYGSDLSQPLLVLEEK